MKTGSQPRDYALAALVVAFCSGVAALMFPHFAPANLTLIYLLGATFCALKLGRGPGIWASFLSVLVFDFGFVPPRFSFSVADAEYLLTFAFLWRRRSRFRV